MRNAVGYPVHAVKTFRPWVNRHGAIFTEWEAFCGAIGTELGAGPLRSVLGARKFELCRVCWPNDHRTYHPAPVEEFN